MMPENFKLCYSRDRIAAEAERLGAEITEWCEQIRRDHNQSVLTIPILRGGIFFYADLVRHISCSVEIAPVQAWGYEVESNQQQESGVQTDLRGVCPERRFILLVDDICDSGKSLASLSEEIQQSGAVEVRSAVLLRRDIKESAFTPDWVGIEHSGPEWFVGYGMDDKDQWRNLADIYVIKQDR